MSVSSRYWKIWRIDPASERTGYKQVLSPLAKQFVQNQLAKNNKGVARKSYTHLISVLPSKAKSA